MEKPMLSGNAIKKLGKRLRDGTYGIEDLDLLDTYRAEFEPLLLETCTAIGAALDGKLKYIVAGRMKRTKSIIRKLARDANAGMDLSRMSDLVGLRIIVEGTRDQDQAIDLLRVALPLVREPYDYRGKSSGYRAVHLVSGTTSHRVETQIRTLAQHLWADESERLGEQVKEGLMNSEEEKYLGALHHFCRAQDHGMEYTDASDEEVLGWQAELERQQKLFEDVTRQQFRRTSRSYVVVYDQTTNSLIRVESFSPEERAEALNFFQEVSRTQDNARYDILVLNSPSRDALVVTHPRYFPEGLAQLNG
jgi:ppGpp synthetase/RelA/SpoT-type nucleotidyltranferase